MALVSANVPVPVLVMPPVPDSTPVRLSAFPLAPTPSVLLRSTLFASDNGAMVSSAPPPAVTTPVPRAAAFSSTTVPALSVVPPV
ncbi:hypothetical protein Xcc1_21410 [Xanthomonas campestris pv. campestris]|nr:hypothetical protein Xcc1_21410 [Xanthomonas campestris pv. campestris]